MSVLEPVSGRSSFRFGFDVSFGTSQRAFRYSYLMQNECFIKLVSLLFVGALRAQLGTWARISSAIQFSVGLLPFVVHTILHVFCGDSVLALRGGQAWNEDEKQKDQVFHRRSPGEK